MDKRLEAPERVWIREDRYGIDLEGAYGAKPKDVDCVEYVRADLARSAPEAASAEGSPSHPSGPSQDSQEVREAIVDIIMTETTAHRSDSEDAADKIIRLPPQSPKGGAAIEISLPLEETLVKHIVAVFNDEAKARQCADAVYAEWMDGEEAGGGPATPAAPEIPTAQLVERIAQIQAHRATHSAEHDVPNGKIHGYCIVCGVPWPCEYVGKPPESAQPTAERSDAAPSPETPAAPALAMNCMTDNLEAAANRIRNRRAQDALEYIESAQGWLRDLRKAWSTQAPKGGAA